MPLLNSYTFLTKRTEFYSVTVGAENEKQAKQIAKNPDYKGDEEDDVVWLDTDKYQVVKLLDKEES